MKKNFTFALVLLSVMACAKVSAQSVVEMRINQNPLFEIFTDQVNTALPAEGGQLLLGANLVVKGGSGEYTYRWYDDTGSTLGETETITVYDEGKYHLDISDTCDCMQTVTFDVTTAGVSDPSFAQFYVSPNPTTGHVEFSATPAVQLTAISTSGMLCALVDNGGEAFVSADLSQLAPGTYIITLTGVDNKVYVARIIKK